MFTCELPVITGIFRHEQTTQVRKEDTKVILSTDMSEDHIITDIVFRDKLMGLRGLMPGNSFTGSCLLYNVTNYMNVS